MKKPYFLLLLIPLLTACSFHLKGFHTAAPPLHTLALTDTENQHHDAYKTLITILENNQITINPNAEWKAIISDYTQTSDIMVNSSANREIELTAGYQVALYHQDKYIGHTTISNRSNIQYASGQYLGSISDKNATLEELYRQNAQATLRYINATIQRQSTP